MPLKLSSRVAIAVSLAGLGALWAVRTGSIIDAPMLRPGWVGYPMGIIGIVLIMLGLVGFEGAYRVYPHPISVGAVLTAFGASIVMPGIECMSCAGPGWAQAARGTSAAAQITGRSHGRLSRRGRCRGRDGERALMTPPPV